MAKSSFTPFSWIVRSPWNAAVRTRASCDIEKLPQSCRKEVQTLLVTEESSVKTRPGQNYNQNFKIRKILISIFLPAKSSRTLQWMVEQEEDKRTDLVMS